MSNHKRQRLSENPLLNYYQCPNCVSPIHRKRKTCRRCGWGRSLHNPLPDRIRSVRQKLLRVGFGAARLAGRALKPCPDCDEQIPGRADRCRYCGWSAGFRPSVRPTLRHFVMEIVGPLRKRVTETRCCPHCQWEMPKKARRCPLCMCTPEFVERETLPMVRAWRHLRRQWGRRAEQRVIVCPDCMVKVPSWAECCLSCGWEPPRDTGRIAVMRYAFSELKGEMRTRFHKPVEAPLGEICPECDMIIPPSDKMCMACGWTEEHKATVLDAAGFVLAEIKHLGTPEKMPELSLCEGCEVPMPPDAKMCLVCGWARPIKNPVVRYLRSRKVRRPRTSDPSARPCPNCQMPLARNGARCTSCRWEKSPTRYYGKTPRAVWATMTVLVVGLYFALQAFVILATGGQGFTPDQDQYGRNRFERSGSTQAPPMTQ